MKYQPFRSSPWHCTQPWIHRYFPWSFELQEIYQCIQAWTSAWSRGTSGTCSENLKQDLNIAKTGYIVWTYYDELVERQKHVFSTLDGSDTEININQSEEGLVYSGIFVNMPRRRGVSMYSALQSSCNNYVWMRKSTRKSETGCWWTVGRTLP